MKTLIKNLFFLFIIFSLVQCTDTSAVSLIPISDQSVEELDETDIEVDQGKTKSGGGSITTVTTTSKGEREYSLNIPEDVLIQTSDNDKNFFSLENSNFIDAIVAETDRGTNPHVLKAAIGPGNEIALQTSLSIESCSLNLFYPDEKICVVQGLTDLNSEILFDSKGNVYFSNTAGIYQFLIASEELNLIKTGAFSTWTVTNKSDLFAIENDELIQINPTTGLETSIASATSFEIINDDYLVYTSDDQNIHLKEISTFNPTSGLNINITSDDYSGFQIDAHNNLYAQKDNTIYKLGKISDSGFMLTTTAIKVFDELNFNLIDVNQAYVYANYKGRDGFWSIDLNDQTLNLLYEVPADQKAFEIEYKNSKLYFTQGLVDSTNGSSVYSIDLKTDEVSLKGSSDSEILDLLILNED